MSGSSICEGSLRIVIGSDEADRQTDRDARARMKLQSCDSSCASGCCRLPALHARWITRAQINQEHTTVASFAVPVFQM